MNRSLTVTVCLVSAALATGCVADRRYRELDQAYRTTLEQVAERDARISELEQQIELLRQGPLRDKATLIALTDENDKLRAELDRLQKELEVLAGRTGDVIVLNPETDAMLKEFAAQHSDLVAYDPARGMLKLRSDVTFALGSADLTGNAAGTLRQLAGILTAGATSQYEVRVIGHTDSVPIGRPSTRAKHPTNWHLSAHRAISVKDGLERAGVPPVRLMVGGYGMYRPVVPNDRRGAEPNRRVEIYLVGMTAVNQSYLSGGGGGVSRSATPAVQAGGAESDEGSDIDDRIPLK